jgi:hypothetical protein
MTAEIKAKTANSKSFTKITSVFLSKRLKLPKFRQTLVLEKAKALLTCAYKLSNCSFWNASYRNSNFRKRQGFFTQE